MVKNSIKEQITILLFLAVFATFGVALPIIVFTDIIDNDSTFEAVIDTIRSDDNDMFHITVHGSGEEDYREVEEILSHNKEYAITIKTDNKIQAIRRSDETIITAGYNGSTLYLKEGA